MSADFGTFIDSFVPEARAMAEKRMKTTWDIEYKVGVEPDPDTDADVPVYAKGFTTMGRLKSPGLMITQAEVGGRTAAESKRELHIPWDSADPWADPRSSSGVTAVCTAIHPTDDPTMLGIRVTLLGPAPGSQTTARRLQVTEVTS
jgi:hypothetical protein